MRGQCPRPRHRRGAELGAHREGEDGSQLERAITGLGEREHYESVECFLLERQPAQDRTLELISAVVADMLRCPPDATIATLAAAHGVSTRSLQRAFQQRVGVSPKWVLKRYRLHEAAERMAIGEADNLSALALDLGYFDVTHFTRQFTAATGEPTGAYAPPLRRGARPSPRQRDAGS